METYRTKQKITNRTLTVELPEEFEGSEVEVKVKVVALKGSLATNSNKKESNNRKALQKPEETMQNSAQSKEERLATIKKFAGIYKPGKYVMPEDEWYKQ